MRLLIVLWRGAAVAGLLRVSSEAAGGPARDAPSLYDGLLVGGRSPSALCGDSSSTAADGEVEEEKEEGASVLMPRRWPTGRR